MATIIPRANIPQTQVGALPRVQAAPVADLSPLARTGEVVGKVATAFLEQAQDRNDTAALLQARRELSDYEAEVFNPGNAEGIAKYRGGNALGATELIPKTDERIGEIRSRLNPRQAAQFDAISGNFRDSLQGRLNIHMDREHTQFIQAETSAAIDNIGNDAISAGIGGDFARQDERATELLAMDRRRLEVEGAGPEVIRASQEAIASTIRAQTALGLVANQPFVAQDYYLRHADQMSPKDRMRVEAVLQPVVEDAENYALAGAIWTGQEVSVSPETSVALDGVDAQIHQLEGTGQNPRSSARGVGQFVDSTWLETIKKHRPDLTEGKSNAEILTLKDDPAVASELLTKFREDNARSLTARGITPNAENLYAAHHFGVGGASKFARAPASTPMTAILSRKEINANPYLKDKTVGEVKANWAQRGLQVAAVSDGPSPQGVPRTLADALAYADQSIQDPRRRKQVKAILREQNAIAESQRNEQEKLVAEQTYAAISANTDPRKPLREIIGPEGYALAARKGSLDTLENYRKNIVTGTLIQDDVVLADSLEREAVLSPNTFKARNLYALADRLSANTLEQLVRKQEDAGKPGKQTEWANTSQRVASGWRQLGLDVESDTNGTKDERKESRAAFALMYRNAERDFIQQNKKPPTPQQADVLLREVVRNAANLVDEDGNTVITLSRGGASFEKYATAIPPQDRAEIVADYRQATGREPTEADIVRIHTRSRGIVPPGNQ